MKPKVVRNHDGFDIVVDKDAWVYHVYSEGDKTLIKFKHSNGNGKNPLTVKDIADLGYL